jgi:hypothetical protein
VVSWQVVSESRKIGDEIQERQPHGLACASSQSGKYESATGPEYLLPAMSVLRHAETDEKGNSLSNARVKEAHLGFLPCLSK